VYKYPISLHKTTYDSSSRTPGGFTFLVTLTPRVLSVYPTQKQALRGLKRKKILNRGSINNPHHKNVIIEKQESFFTEKHFTSQEVFHFKTLHSITSIFTQKYLMSQISFFTRKLHK
jgi:hypothetical protein